MPVVMDRNLVIDPKSLTSEDLSLMELIRQFYSVLDLQKSYTDLMKELLEINRNSFDIFVEKYEVPNSQSNNGSISIFVTAVVCNGMKDVLVASTNEFESKSKAFEKTIENLIMINDTVTLFCMEYRPHKPIIEVMEKLQQENSEFIDIKIETNVNSVRVSICLWTKRHFIAECNNEYDAKLKAYSEVAGYLDFFYKRMIEPYWSNSKRSRPLVKDHKSSVLDVIIRFNAAYKKNSSYIEVMKEMMSGDESFEITSSTTWDKKKDTKAYQSTLVHRNLGSFTAVDTTKIVSRNGARKLCYERLLSHVKLLQYFHRVYTPKKSKKDLVKKLTDNFGELLKEVKVKSNGNKGVKAAIHYVNFMEFTGESLSEEDAINIACQNLVEHLKNCSNQFYDEFHATISAKEKENDPFLIRRIKLMSEFCKVFEPEKAKSQIVLELMENVVSTIKCEQSPETSCFVSILDFNGLGTIFSCAENEEKAFEIVFDRALTFLTNQMVFFMEFQELFCNEQLQCLEIMEKLDSVQITTIPVSKLIDDKIDPTLNVTMIKVQNMIMFAKLRSSESESKMAASKSAFEFILNVAKGINLIDSEVI